MYAVNRKTVKGNWEKITETDNFATAVNMARAILPAIYLDLYVDDEDVEYFNEEFDKQALTEDVYIESIINIEKVA